MADLVHNIAKGRVVEFYNRVENNDPSPSALVISIFNAGATDDAIRDADTLAAIEALSSTDEVNNTGYARKVLTDAQLAALPAPDDTNNRYDISLPDQTWTSVAAGTAWTDLSVSYDADTGSGTDSNILPLTWHDFAVTPDGSDITAQFAAAGFFRAS